MRNKFFLPIIIVVLGVALGGGVFAVYRNFGQKPAGEKTERKSAPAKESSQPSAKIEINFIKEGYYAKDGERLGFLYEEPGKLALSLNLKFVAESICDFGKGEAKCDLGQLQEGSRVVVEGNKANDELTVAKLKKI